MILSENDTPRHRRKTLRLRCGEIGQKMDALANMISHPRVAFISTLNIPHILKHRHLHGQI